jgi:hypothetical protein
MTVGALVIGERRDPTIAGNVPVARQVGVVKPTRGRSLKPYAKNASEWMSYSDPPSDTDLSEGGLLCCHQLPQRCSDP